MRAAAGALSANTSAEIAKGTLRVPGAPRRAGPTIPTKRTALHGVTSARPLVATKGGHWRDGEIFPVDARPDILRAHCDTSLRTLKVDRIDLYHLHHLDPEVPLTDSVGALEQLRRVGKIAAVGLSNVTIAQLDQALTVAPVAAVQNRLGYGCPGDLPTALACAERDIAYLAYSPLGGPSNTPSKAAQMIAERCRVSPQRVLLAWLRRQSPNIIPLVGASRPASIRDSAMMLDITDDDLRDMRDEKQAAQPEPRTSGHHGRVGD